MTKEKLVTIDTGIFSRSYKGTCETVKRKLQSALNGPGFTMSLF